MQTSQHKPIELGVNVDHIATLRQARGTTYPDPMQAADIARQAGAEGITVHLREDRRHIQDYDVINIRKNVALPLNLEMAATVEMLGIAIQLKPAEVCIVPEKREELTTEGGLDVSGQQAHLTTYISQLKAHDIKVSLFIDPDERQIKSSYKAGADIVEIHTGTYAECEGDEQLKQLAIIKKSTKYADSLGLQVNAGHGLHYQNVQPIAAIAEIVCLNIGHSIVARASLSGFHEAVFTMKKIMIEARLESEADS